MSLHSCTMRDPSQQQWRRRQVLSPRANLDNHESCLDLFPCSERPTLVTAEELNDHAATTPCSRLWPTLTCSWKPSLVQSQSSTAPPHGKVACSCHFYEFPSSLQVLFQRGRQGVPPARRWGGSRAWSWAWSWAWRCHHGAQSSSRAPETKTIVIVKGNPIRSGIIFY